MSGNAVFPKFKAWRANGITPANGYKLYTYESGTTTPKTAYSNSALTVAHANPIILDSIGEASIFLDSGSYRFDLYTNNDSLVWTFDPVVGASSSLVSSETIATLRTLSNQVDGSICVVLGHSSVGDGGEGLFRWDAASTDTDDNGITITPNSAPAIGRWKRLYSNNTIYSSWYGFNSSALSNILTTISTDSYTLVANSSLILSGNTTIGDNIALVIELGAQFSAASSYNLTIEGPLVAPRIDWLSTNVTLLIPSTYVSEGFPEWCGAIADGSTDCLAALQAIIATGVKRVSLAAGTYCISNTLSIANKSAFTLTGVGLDATTIKETSSFSGTLVTLRGSKYCSIRGITFDGNSLNTSLLTLPRYNSGAGDTYNQIGHSIDDCKFTSGPTGSFGLDLGDSLGGGTQLDNVRISRCLFANCGTLVRISGNVTFHINFSECIFSAYDAIPTLYSVQLLDSCGLVYFKSCQFIGSAPIGGHVTRARECKNISFIDCEMEGPGTLFTGEDDTGLNNTNPVEMINCVWGNTGAVGGTANFGIASGSPICTVGATGSYSLGQHVTGAGIPDHAHILSIQANVSITLNKNATATNASASLTVQNSILDYKQLGLLKLDGGKISGSNPSYMKCYAGATRGLLGGSVIDFGVLLANASYQLSNAAQLTQFDRFGKITVATDRLTVDGSTGTTSIPGAISTGALTSSGAITAAGVLTSQHATLPGVISQRTTNAASADEVASSISRTLNASGVSRDVADIVTKLDTATNTSEESSLLFKLYRAGSKVTAAILSGLGIFTITGANQGRVIAARTNNSSSSSEPGTFEVSGPNASGTSKTWVRLRGYVKTATAGAEDGLLALSVLQAGSETDALIVGDIAPSTASSTGIKGTVVFDASYIYVCTATNTWKRVAIATF